MTLKIKLIQTIEQTDDFKRRLQTARELLDKLPGGELQQGSQDEVIKVLEMWRDHKRSVLTRFFIQEIDRLLGSNYENILLLRPSAIFVTAI